MRSPSLLALVGLGALLGGCVTIVEDDRTREVDCGLTASGGGVFMTPSVVVYDEQGRDLCGARVVAREGAFEATLSATPSACHRFELPARVGVYEVTVERDGYGTYVESGVRVAESYGCAGPGRVGARLLPEERNCDASAALSFQVDLRDERGVPVCDASVVVRDGAFQQALRPFSSGDGACFWDGPAERPGTYEVTITKPGYDTVVLSQVVVAKEPSGCHVVPAKVSAQLVPAAVGCTLNLIEALDLNIVDEFGEQVCDATVTARDGDFGAVLEANGQCSWTGLPERGGVYDVTIEKPGYVTVVLEDVVVTSDVCHVKQVSLDVTLMPDGAPLLERSGR